MCATWGSADWMLAITGEVGELANLIKKQNRDGFTEDRQEEISKELADIVLYVDLLANHMGVDLGAVVASKFNEVSDRRRSPIRLPVDL
jgi:NTP pyrophosphatase (non-canonical NTP hydrolase)